MEEEVVVAAAAAVPAPNLPMRSKTPQAISVRDFLLRCLQTTRNHRRCAKFAAATLVRRLSKTPVAPSNL